MKIPVSRELKCHCIKLPNQFLKIQIDSSSSRQTILIFNIQIEREGIGLNTQQIENLVLFELLYIFFPNSAQDFTCHLLIDLVVMSPTAPALCHICPFGKGMSNI